MRILIKRFGENFQKNRVENLLCWVALLATAVFWIPIINLGFFWDDNVLSTLPGTLELHHWGIWDWIRESTVDTLRDMGRFYPLCHLSLPLYFMDRIPYHLSIYVLILGNLILTARFYKDLLGEKSVPFWTYVWVPLLFQIRSGADPHHSYGGLMQFHWFEILISFFFFLKYLRKKKIRFLAGSLLFYTFSLFTYEMSYPYFLLYPVIARIEGKKWKGALKAMLPFLIVTGVSAALVLGLRWSYVLPQGNTRGNYTPHLQPLSILLAFLNQMSAAFPLTYTLLGGRRIQEVNKFLWSHWDWIALVASLLVGVALLLAANTGRKRMKTQQEEEEDRRAEKRLSSKAPLLLGLLIWALPGLLISLSPKYQSGWIQWGLGYLPVYESSYGVLLLAVLLSLKIRRGALKNQTWKLWFWRGFFVCVPFLVYWNMSSNSLVLRELNRYFRPDREVAEFALDHGFFESVQNNSYLLMDTQAFPGGNISFYQQHAGKAFKRIATPGRFLGEAHNERTALIELVVPRNFEWIPPSAKFPKVIANGVVQYQLGPDEPVYYWRYQATGESQGYGILGLVERLETSSAQIFGAFAKEGRVFLWNIGGPQHLSFLDHLPLKFEPLKSGPDWQEFRVTSQSGDGLLNLGQWK